MFKLDSQCGNSPVMIHIHFSITYPKNLWIKHGCINARTVLLQITGVGEESVFLRAHKKCFLLTQLQRTVRKSVNASIVLSVMLSLPFL